MFYQLLYTDAFVSDSKGSITLTDICRRSIIAETCNCTIIKKSCYSVFHCGMDRDWLKQILVIYAAYFAVAWSMMVSFPWLLVHGQQHETCVGNSLVWGSSQ